MDYKATDTELTSIANAIRTKGRTSEPLAFPTDFVGAINNISGDGAKIIDEEDWLTMSSAQKRAQGLAVIQTASDGYIRGKYVDSSLYVGEILQSATASSSAALTMAHSGTFQLVVIAMNSEGSTHDLTVSATLNDIELSGETLEYNTYHRGSDNERNHRISAYNITVTAGDVLNVELTNKSSYSSFVCAVIDGEITNVMQAISKADAISSGSYTEGAIVLKGTFDSNQGGTINLYEYTANTVISTENPGSNYKSSYIFWCK